KDLQVMFGFTAKITKKRIVCAVIIIMLPLLIFAAVKISSIKSATNEIYLKNTKERIAYLTGFGWQIDENSETEKASAIPAEFDDVYKSYNELQISQGFDLSDYAGKSVTIYNYKVLNYPENSEYVYATLILYDEKLIGGDIHSTALDGFMHGFDLSGTGLKFDNT
ncbi:MAG: DUF4830 domain-containing protein, partial [Acutalibacteraceae bacterium]